MAYQPIENYGLIGNMRTAALVGLNGSIDWYCFPHFDSPSVFAHILDDEIGGYFRIAPDHPAHKSKQFYWPDTNVLVTRFVSETGVAEVQDFMPAGHEMDACWHHQLVRRVLVVKGQMAFTLSCEPAFDYARKSHVTRISSQGATFHSTGLELGLSTDIPLTPTDRGVTASFILEESQTASFVLRMLSDVHDCGKPSDPAEVERLFKQTVCYWRNWLSQSCYDGNWREAVNRSALALKLLTFEPTGAIIAAPTTSLPESIGANRNWDYRFTWIRDAAFSIYGLLRLGFTSEAIGFMEWLDARCREHDATADAPLQIVYSIDGNRDLKEETLAHLKGYRNSRPVRIGNQAHAQLQLDIYGELMDAVYLSNKYARPLSYEAWTHLRKILDWLSENWDRPDEGIWEMRSGQQNFVYSRLMSWVALDRGLRLADKRSFPANREKWLRARDEIYEQVMEKGWSAKRQSFVQSYGSDLLDASALIMPLVFFLSPNDPRMQKTLSAIYRPLKNGGLVSDGLVYRYENPNAADGFSSKEGTFNMCTFWLVEALTRSGRLDKGSLNDARLIFERMIGYGNHLGLYSEEISDAGEALGNFPQAFTHVALISSAFNLDLALRKKKPAA